MLNLRKTLIVIPILLFMLACQLGSLQKVEEGAATFSAIATDVEEISTEIAPLETLVAAPTNESGQPDGNVFNPSAPAVATWREIPIIPEAIAGEEAQGFYGYKVDAPAEDIEAYYSRQLPPLGWVAEFVMPYADGMGMMMFTRDTNALTITISDVEGIMLVLLNLQ